jgi:hypothetical protein
VLFSAGELARSQPLLAARWRSSPSIDAVRPGAVLTTRSFERLRCWARPAEVPRSRR